MEDEAKKTVTCPSSLALSVRSRERDLSQAHEPLGVRGHISRGGGRAHRPPAGGPHRPSECRTPRLRPGCPGGGPRPGRKEVAGLGREALGSRRGGAPWGGRHPASAPQPAWRRLTPEQGAGLLVRGKAGLHSIGDVCLGRGRAGGDRAPPAGLSCPECTALHGTVCWEVTSSVLFPRQAVNTLGTMAQSEAAAHREPRELAERMRGGS